MNAQKGFTTLELITVMLIVAVLMGIGVPSFRYVGNQNRMSMEVNSLLADLQYARSEALREGKTVTTCASTNGTACNGGTAWRNGWVVYSNPANLTTFATSQVLRIRTAFVGSTPDTFTAPVNYVTFNREGFATTGAGFVTSKFVLTEQTNNNSYTRCLLVAPVGSLSTATRAASASC